MQFKTLALLAAVGSAVAQRPSNTTICDYYTTALLKTNNATNQMTLLTLLVNTAVIGNYSAGAKNAVTGILNPGVYNGTEINLLPYFDGGLNSTNMGGMSGVSVNFLDDGGAVPLMMNKPANGTSSNQYMLLTHLYEYFGVLLGCSMIGQPGYPAYAGDASQYEVHKFMDLNPLQLGYFIAQVASSAASFGVATSDIQAVGMALTQLFDYRCSPPTTVVPAQGPQLQAICLDPTCPVAMNATCASYINQTVPLVANASLAMGEGTNMTSMVATATSLPSGTATMSMMASGTATMSMMASGTVMPGGSTSTPATSSKNDGMRNLGSLAGVVGAAALAFAL